MRNGWLAFALLLAACMGAAVRPVVFPAASAAAPSERCEWRYMIDGGGMDIPENSETTPMGEEWAAMSAAGFRLATIADSSGTLIFERCTPTQ